MTDLDFDLLEFSETRMEISKALVVAQRACGDVFKDANNPAFKSKYASLASVLNAARPAFLSAGIAILQSPSASYENGNARVTAETLLLHESGEWARAVLVLQPTKSDPQAIGSAATYGRRYQMLGLAGLAPEDDDGSSASLRDDRDAMIAQRDEAIVDLQTELAEYSALSVKVTTRLIARSVPFEWQVATALDCSKQRTKVWASLQFPNEMLAFYRAIDASFPAPAKDAEKAPQATLGIADERQEPPALETPAQGNGDPLAVDEKKRREEIMRIERAIRDIGTSEDETSSLAGRVREMTLDADPESPYATTYNWRTLTLAELGTFWKLLPKKARETAGAL